MLRFVDKLTVAPATMRRDDVENLRGLGFEDVDILAIAEVAAYYERLRLVTAGPVFRAERFRTMLDFWLGRIPPPVIPPETPGA